jgi:hypothetical protein
MNPIVATPDIQTLPNLVEACELPCPECGEPNDICSEPNHDFVWFLSNRCNVCGHAWGTLYKDA